MSPSLSVLACWALLGTGPVQRSVPAATPADASQLIYLDDMAAQLEPALDAFDRALGADQTAAFLADAALPSLALAVLAGGPTERRGLAHHGGLGMFRWPAFDGAVGLIEVTEGEAALEAVGTHLDALGASELSRTPELRVRGYADGTRVGLFVERGYLYLLLPEEEGLDLEAKARMLRAALGHPLADAASFVRLRARVDEGQLYVLVRSPVVEPPLTAGLFSVRLSPRRTKVDGYVESTRTVLTLPARDAPSVAYFLSRAPSGPTFVASARLGAAALAELFAGAERPMLRDQVRALGFDLDRLLASLGGEVSTAFYADSTLFVAAVLGASQEEPGEEPVVGPLGTVLLEANVRDAEALRGYLVARIAQGGRPMARVDGRRETRLRTLVQGQPVELGLSPGKLRLSAGPSVAARDARDVAADLRGDLPAGAFGPGHLTAVVDLGQLRRELAAPALLGGSPEERDYVRAVQRALRHMLATSQIDRFGLDVGRDAVDPRAVRVSGEILYREVGLEAPGSPAPSLGPSKVSR